MKARTGIVGTAASCASSLSEQVREAAREQFGWTTLRPQQTQAVCALVEGCDVLAVMPTGWGKSAIYQLAGGFLEGPTVVISPLRALQRDQVLSLQAAGGLGAVAVNSDATAVQERGSWHELLVGAAGYVFLTPEQLSREDVLDRLAVARPSLLVVDEAHCVSVWGHDFRPDYLRIGDALERLGRPRVLALTATASPPVRAEILQRLRMDSAKEMIHGFDRPNVSLSVQLFSDEASKQAAVVESAVEAVHPGLVYVGRRKDSEWYAEHLRARGVRAAAFHSGLRGSERERIHRDWLGGALDVVVATSAFGMGIDKPDVRFVLHAHISESLDAYYQEIGRAGRNGEPANAVLFYRIEDLGLRRFFASGGFDEAGVRQVATAIHARPTRMAALQQDLSLSPRRLAKIVSLLEKAEVIEVDGDRRASWTGRGTLDNAAEDAQRVAESIRKANQSRLEMMRGYAETLGCRRRFLLGYFGELLTQPCGNCDRCAQGPSSDLEDQPAAVLPGNADLRPYQVNARVTHQSWGPGVVMHVESDRMTILFDQVGYKTLSLELVEDQHLLTLTEGS